MAIDKKYDDIFEKALKMQRDIQNWKGEVYSLDSLKEAITNAKTRGGYDVFVSNYFASLEEYWQEIKELYESK